MHYGKCTSRWGYNRTRIFERYAGYSCHHRQFDQPNSFLEQLLCTHNSGSFWFGCNELWNFGQRFRWRRASYLVAVGYALGAVLAWLMFSILNQKILAKIPQVHSGLWTGLMMSGAGVSVLLFLPFGLVFGVYSYPHIDLRLDNTLPVFAAASALACFASVGGAWAWNIASQRLPMALSGQLISVETIFAAAFGLICAFHAIRPPSPPTSGHPFHAHPARQSERSDAGLHC